MRQSLVEARRLAGIADYKGALAWLKSALDTSDVDALDAVLVLSRTIEGRTDGRLQRQAQNIISGAAYRRRDIAGRTFDLTAVLAFAGLGQVDVNIRRGAELVADRVLREAETLLFCLYAARQIANLGAGEDLSLDVAETMLTAGTPAGLAGLIAVGPGDVRVRSNDGLPALKLGFRAHLRHPAEISRFGALPDLLNRIGFQLEVKGFPKSGEGLGYYAPTSVLVLLYQLARRRADDEEFLVRLGFGCHAIATAGAAGEISVTNQALPAIAATLQAWTADSLDELFETADDAVEAVDPEPVGHEPSMPPDADPALRIARERYARGEISRDEFKQIEADLHGR